MSKTQIENEYYKSVLPFAEAIYTARASTAKAYNAFGRRVSIHNKGGLSILMGQAVTGLRCTAFLTSDELKNEYANLATFRRLRLPLTVAIEQSDESQLPELFNTASIVFQANGSQALHDLLWIGQVISEKSLCPVVVLYDGRVDELSDFDQDQTISWFGDPDERVAQPTEAQNIVFGGKRRRVPAWLHMDQSILVGASKDNPWTVLEEASGFTYDKPARQALIDETMALYNKLFGREYNSWERLGHKKPNHLMISLRVDAEVWDNKKFDKHLSKRKTTLMVPVQLKPVVLNLPQVNSIQVLEPFAKGLSAPFYNQLASYLKLQPISHGWFTEAPPVEQLKAVLEYASNKENNNKEFWVGVALQVNHSAFPKHEVLLQHLRRAYPNLDEIQVGEATAAQGPAIGPMPQQIRRHRTTGPVYSHANRFFEDTINIWSNASESLIADPFQAYPVVPASTAAITKLSNNDSDLPHFQPHLCTAIDDLLLSCPYKAISSTVLTVESLVNTGMDQMKKVGQPPAQLIPVKKKLIKSVRAYIKENQKEIRRVSDFLKPVAESLKDELKEDKQKALEDELSAMIQCVGNLPVVIDDHLYLAADKAKAGMGLLFITAVNPTACTGCGNCSLSQDPACMNMRPAVEIEQGLQAEFESFEKLPATARETVSQIINDEKLDPLAAMMLNKDYHQLVANASEAGEQRTMQIISHILAHLQFIKEPIQQSVVQRLTETKDKLNAGIQKILGNSLPMNRMEELKDVLARHSEQRVNMNEIFEEWAGEARFNSVERSKLERKLELVNALDSLTDLLQEGASGTGRATGILVLDEELDSLAKYPLNPFAVPVLQSNSADASDMLHGVCTGQMRHYLDQVRLERRAALEAADKYVKAKHAEELSNLSWDDLTVTEREAAPVILYLTTMRAFSNSSVEAVNRLLEQSYPVKLISINKEAGTESWSERHTNYNLLWAYVAQGKAAVAQTVFGDSSMYDTVRQSLALESNSILSIYAPMIEDMDVHPTHWRQLTPLIRSSRVYLQWSFVAGDEQGVASKIETLVDDIHLDFFEVDVPNQKNDIRYPMSIADWAFLHTELKQEFETVADNDNNMFIDEYMGLEAAKRAEFVPVILRQNNEGELQYYSMSAHIVDMVTVQHRSLQLLREWAGRYTDFPDKLRAEVEAELRKEFSLKQEEFERDLDKAKADWEANYLKEIKERVKGKLLNMSQMK